MIGTAASHSACGAAAIRSWRVLRASRSSRAAIAMARALSVVRVGAESGRRLIAASSARKLAPLKSRLTVDHQRRGIS